MGAWNHSLIGNDIFQDEMYNFNKTRLSELNAYFSAWNKLAKDESQTFMLSEDHLPLEFDELTESKDEFLFNEEQNTSYREMFCGLVDVIVTEKPELLRYLLPNQLQDALDFTKQLCHGKFLSNWRNPDERLAELFNFKKRVEQALKDKLDQFV